MNIMRQQYKLISEVRKHPYLYDKRHPRYNDKEEQAKAWDSIAANYYQDQWDNLTYADKARKARYLQSRITSEEYSCLAGLHVAASTSGSAADTVNPIPGNSRDNPTVDDVQEQETIPVVSRVVAKPKAVVDEDQELLLLFLLPTYKMLTPNDKLEVLHECYVKMKDRLAATTTVIAD